MKPLGMIVGILIFCFLSVDLGLAQESQKKSISQALDIIEHYFENQDQRLNPVTEERYQSVQNENQKEMKESDQKKQAKIMIDVLELKDMDIGDVLKLISKKSGLNIVKGRNVKGQVTIYLKDVDVRDALRIIMESNDLAYAEEDGIISVMTAKDYELAFGHRFGEKTQIKIYQLKHASAADAVALLSQIKSIIGKVIADEKSNTVVLIDTPERLEAMDRLVQEIDVAVGTQVFKLSYAKAEDVSKQIEEIITKNIGLVKYDERSNKVIVTDTTQKLKRIENLIDAFDEKHKEVSISAKIIQLTLTDQYKMGVDWEAIVSDYHSLTLKSDFDILSATDKKGKVSIGTLSTDDYTAFVEALDTIGTTDILSSPSITVINNEEAKILVGSTQPYVTTTTTTPSSGATTTAESVNFIDVGVQLYVTPTIHDDGYITMNIKPEVSSVTSFLTTGNNNQIPVVETSEAETTVMVKDRTTIVIGGLIKDEKLETVKKVPLLGDVPVLGNIFRNKDSYVRKTEIVIFLTPEIISGDSSVRKFQDDF